MMKNLKIPVIKRFKVLFVLPAIAIAFYAFAKPNYVIAEENNAVNNFIEAADTTTIKTEKKVENAVEEEIFTIVEIMPEFPGGIEALTKFIADNVKYPETSKAKKEQGRVFVMFIVNKEGKVTNTTIAKGVSSDLDEEALRAVNSMPLWKPGENKGKKVNVSYTIPINFTL